MYNIEPFCSDTYIGFPCSDRGTAKRFYKVNYAEQLPRLSVNLLLVLEQTDAKYRQ